jgi:flagellar hook-associated protein 3 FlgL
MVTSVSTANSYSSVLSELLSAQNSEITAQQQVSTGKLGNDLQAFGAQTGNLVATNTVKARVDQLVSQLNAQQVQLNFQQTGLTSLSTVAGDVQSTLTNALANGSGDGIMTELQSYFSQAAEALNSQYGGQYLFAGGQTQTQPFTATSLADLTTQPSVNSFFQNGGLTPVTRIDDSTTIQSGFLASGIGSSLMSAFQSIQTFQQSANGNFGGALTPAQQTFLQGMITQMSTVTDAATQTAAQGGEIQSQVDTATTTQTNRQTTLTNMLGDITDVNMAQAASNLSQAQSAVQASAQVFLTLKGMSLLNYLAAPTPAG